MTRLEQLREQQKEFECLPNSTMRMYSGLGICGCQACPHDVKCNRLLDNIVAEREFEERMQNLDNTIKCLETP